jgi:hypothetical protein
MLLKKNSIMYSLTVIILIAIFVIYLSDGNKPTYGNDKETIEKVIKSIEGYENESIEILEIKDIYDDRVVGFLSNNNPAYIQFSKNKKGNYVWRHIEKSASQSFASNIIHVSNDEESKDLKFMIITNQKNNIAKMELGVNEQVIEQEFSVNKKSVTWIDLPESNGKTYTFKYKYYDKDGNLIGDN